jgi:hypothetical protein
MWSSFMVNMWYRHPSHATEIKKKYTNPYGLMIPIPKYGWEVHHHLKMVHL